MTSSISIKESYSNGLYIDRHIIWWHKFVENRYSKPTHFVPSNSKCNKQIWFDFYFCFFVCFFLRKPVWISIDFAITAQLYRERERRRDCFYKRIIDGRILFIRLANIKKYSKSSRRQSLLLYLILQDLSLIVDRDWIAIFVVDDILWVDRDDRIEKEGGGGGGERSGYISKVIWIYRRPSYI